MIVDTEDLIGALDIARLAGVVPSAVSNWRQRYDDFPEPVLVISDRHEVFDREQVEDWLTKPREPINDRNRVPGIRVRRAIRAIVDYDMASERADYEREGRPEGHIYEELAVVNTWLDRIGEE